MSVSDFRVKVDNVLSNIVEARRLYGAAKEESTENQCMSKINGLLREFETIIGSDKTAESLHNIIDSFIAHQTYMKGTTLYNSQITGGIIFDSNFRYKGIAAIIFETYSSLDAVWSNILVDQFCKAVKVNNEDRIITLANLMLIDQNKTFTDELSKANINGISDAINKHAKYTSDWYDPYLD